MNTQTVILRPPSLSPATVVLIPSLLTETSSVTRPADPGDVAPEQLKLRPSQAAVALSEILEQRGYLHGGINE